MNVRFGYVRDLHALRTCRVDVLLYVAVWIENDRLARCAAPDQVAGLCESLVVKAFQYHAENLVEAEPTIYPDPGPGRKSLGARPRIPRDPLSGNGPCPKRRLDRGFKRQRVRHPYLGEHGSRREGLQHDRMGHGRGHGAAAWDFGPAGSYGIAGPAHPRGLRLPSTPRHISAVRRSPVSGSDSPSRLDDGPVPFAATRLRRRPGNLARRARWRARARPSQLHASRLGRARADRAPISPQHESGARVLWGRYPGVI